jgi:hypothetical protein
VASVGTTWTPATFENIVTGAQQYGGGWIIFTVHDVCPRTCLLGVTEPELDSVVGWLSGQAAHGMEVRTVHQVIGGPVRPAVRTASAADPFARRHQLPSDCSHHDGRPKPLPNGTIWYEQRLVPLSRARGGIRDGGGSHLADRLENRHVRGQYLVHLDRAGGVERVLPDGRRDVEVLGEQPPHSASWIERPGREVRRPVPS